jgi:hypothetical protein
LWWNWNIPKFPFSLASALTNLIKSQSPTIKVLTTSNHHTNLRFLTRQSTQHFTQLIILILQATNTFCKIQILYSM